MATNDAISSERMARLMPPVGRDRKTVVKWLRHMLGQVKHRAALAESRGDEVTLIDALDERARLEETILGVAEDEDGEFLASLPACRWEAWAWALALSPADLRRRLERRDARPILIDEAEDGPTIDGELFVMLCAIERYRHAIDMRRDGGGRFGPRPGRRKERVA
jgi:hypothetical protein